jgi:hypothetical protein
MCSGDFAAADWSDPVKVATLRGARIVVPLRAAQ